MTFFVRSPVLSIFAVLLQSASVSNSGMVVFFSGLTISYLCLCAYYTIFRIKIFNYYYIASGRYWMTLHPSARSIFRGYQTALLVLSSPHRSLDRREFAAVHRSLALSSHAPALPQLLGPGAFRQSRYPIHGQSRSLLLEHHGPPQRHSLHRGRLQHLLSHPRGGAVLSHSFPRRISLSGVSRLSTVHRRR